MKKTIFLISIAALMFSCNNSDKQEVNREKMRADSLERELKIQRNQQDRLLGLINDVETGFAQINEAEGRITLLGNDVEGNNSEESIRENLLFIEETMASNRKKIAELERQLKNSSSAGAQLKAKLTTLTAQLEEHKKEIAELRSSLAEKDLKIEKLDSSIVHLNRQNTNLVEENKNKTQIVENQDAQLNTAWYVYGTSKELKEHKILDSGDVLKNGDYDKDYFIKIDIRETTVIPFGSKYAKLLTNHPSGSYTLMKDAKGEYTLHITDTYKFWSVSKYLVVRVK